MPYVTVYTGEGGLRAERTPFCLSLRQESQTQSDSQAAWKKINTVLYTYWKNKAK